MDVRPTRDGWVGRCPCSDHNGDGDQHPSLRITTGEDGRILVHCRVGCATDAVLDAIGLDWPDLFLRDGGVTEQIESSTAGGLIETPPGASDPDLCHRAYHRLLEYLPLSEEHRQNLRQRGLPDDEITGRGYASLRNVDRGRAAHAVFKVLDADLFTVPGFVLSQFGPTLHGEATGLLVPVRDLQGRIVALKIRRSGEPKYVYLTSGPDGPSPGSPVHVPLGVAAPTDLVRVTEGEVKADVAFALDGTPTIGVPGVTQWRGAIPILRDLGAKTVIITFDAPDVRHKLPVLEQAEAFLDQLQQNGFVVEVEIWDDE
jgi:hypothetical protein